jgi:predicted RNA binding protein YcfA (HicA-like mRNA interferase family)
LPLAKGQAHVAAFVRAGWTLVRVKGSHHMMEKKGVNATLSIPCTTKDLKRGLLSDQIQAAGLSEEQYLDFFHNRKRKAKMEDDA